jgi:hypothetical protein
MGGGLMQLVAYGAQDIYLTGNPQITFFKVVYRRHTNFSMEAIQQTFNGNVGTGESTVTATISRNGDLVGQLWLDVAMASQTVGTGNNFANWINNTGHAFVKQCEVEIGGQLIDKQYGHWLDIWNELTDHDESEWPGLNKHADKAAYMKADALTGTDTTPRLYIPLKFWFCRNPGLALPLIALQYHEVKIKLTTRAMNALVVGDYTAGVDAVKPTSVQLWADYIYLDTDERRRFAQVSHEYLIEQLQKEESAAGATKKLNFNHPIKELIWVNQDATVLTVGVEGTGEDVSLNVGGADMTKGNDFFNYDGAAAATSERIWGVASNESFGTLRLQLNGHDRFAARNASYFRLCQPVQAGHRVPSKHIYCYSFALKPEEHQPSGTCNFSRIDNAQMKFDGTAPTGTLTVYAINYNVLRIMSGMGGLAYSN